ncbi:hypothetical protein LZ757_08560 [Xylella fastidiosa subsp. morus]|jgi:hypothetical protein|uniref:hypothetical protein n=1 Tax=Xylella fastidiosa TaxID=2371 RepID=UPI0002E1EDC4|nr:hypothetical protein [Xylella fastidiosa]EWG13374.1 hypothetical protein P910_003385 [Xylella fastidiosa Mul-MD]UIN27368.1 hypothetical protein IUD23_08645 [Xylella fastidiosa subsp. morus]UIT36101.1 hypothetical protein LZ757_08560 [Xylella fastidiosa subsp. morus]UIT38394.1 hypothetical protein LZ755_08585 [Xylella fastidiosa subsp. morus]UIT42779.1 hypothetical protein LZ758_08295 [Xylella fastidiosa subsp. morus]
MTLNVSEQAQPQASKALSGTQKAPLFYWNGIRDEKGAELQRAMYTLRPPYDSESAIRVTALDARGFSLLIHSCFEVYNSADGLTGPYGNDHFTVRIAHPQHAQVKAAFEAWLNRYEAQLVASEKKRQEKRNAARAALATYEAAASNGVAASETKKAPLFYWNGIRDEEAAELQRASYSLVSPRDPNSAIKVSCLDRPLPLFSDLVCRCFVVRFDSEDRSCHYFIVDSSHPQYEQVRAAYKDAVFMSCHAVSGEHTDSDEVAA